jgi:2-polyprenyl-6-methoxyphenol hydroxylase-like FAD-dependent oxidoreductase
VDPQRISVVTDRRALGELLLTGLDDVVEFGRAAVAATDTGDGARLTLADGGTETGDLVVAADGIDSVLRAGIAPDAEVIDTGLRGLSGRTTLDAALVAELPAALHAGQSPVIGPDGLTMVIGLCDYVQWTVVGLPEAFGVSVDLTGLTAAGRRELAADLTRDWSPVLHGLTERAAPDAVDLIALRAAPGVPEWSTTRVTPLGDAVHATTAFGGSGGSVALRDADRLASGLGEVAAGRGGLLDAVRAYEVEMRAYGAEAALRSLRGAERLFRVYIPALG